MVVGGRRTNNDNNGLVAAALPPTVAGIAAFGSTLAVSTFCQLKVLGVSTGTPAPIPTLLGIASVAVASLASHGASVQTYWWLHQGRDYNTLSRGLRDSSSPQEKVAVSVGGDVNISAHTLRICALGLVAFKLLGGRFWAVAPSSYTSLGSFARFSIPATERYATSTQRASIERLGSRVGCHTCGSRRLLLFFPGIKKLPRFHGDHMPPKAVAEQMNARWFRKLHLVPKVKFRFFPQCTPCSNQQGSILSVATRDLRSTGLLQKQPNLAQAGGGKLAHFHGLRPRLCHLAGGVIGGFTVGASEKDILDGGNRRRYRELHEQIETWVHDVYKRAKNLRP